MKGSLVVVDTSVFISHFRGHKEETFKELLLNDQIYLSSFVRLELLQGVKQSEYKQLNRVLSGLHEIPFSKTIMEEAEKILNKVKSKGLVVGIVDLLIAAESNVHRCPVYSLDSIFEKLAKMRLVAVL